MPYYGPGTPWHDRREKLRAAGDLEANLSTNVNSSITTTSGSKQLPGDQCLRWGRGGVGNYAERPDSTRHSDALAADQATVPSPLSQPRMPVSSSDATSRYLYSRTGRGGAGNYGEAVDAAEQVGTAPDESLQFTREIASTPINAYGRGGLGNHAAKALQDEEQSKQAEQGEQRKREALQLEVRKDVEESLAMPQRAKLPLSSPKDARLPT